MTSVEVVVPPELALDELSRQRLIERLESSPPDVTAVAAPLGAIDPGSSTVVQAEWAAIDAQGQSPGPATDREITAAVAVRAGVDHVVGPRSVTVDHGTILVDPAARTTDPLAEPAPVEPAGPRARPPFRRRPVVLFLEGADPLPHPESLRDLVNGLVEHEVEARLATDHPMPGPHLTRVCAPTESSWRALEPDIAVLADPVAFDRATAWCHQRGTVFVDLDPTLGSAIELVSWTIGQAQGRLRARIGPSADPGEFARLVNRLCAGPQPEPPSDRPGTPVSAPSRGADRLDEPDDEEFEDRFDDEPDDGCGATVTTRSVGRVAVTVGTRTAPGAAGRVDQLEAAGHQVRVLDPRTDQPVGDGSGVALLIVDPAIDPADLAAWLDRAGTGARVILDLAGAADGPAAPMPDPSLPGDDRTLELAGVAGAVLVHRPDQAAAWRARGVRAQVAPVLLTRAQRESLRAAAAHRLDPAAPLFGWRLDPVAGPEPELGDAIAAALTELLTRDPEVLVEVVGVLPIGPLHDHPRVTIRSDPPDPGQLAAWTAQIWSPAASADTAGPAVFEAAFAGVPTVTARAVAGTDGELTISPAHDATAWLAALEALTDDRSRRRWSARAQARAEGLRGPEASRTAVERFMGWTGAIIGTEDT